MVNKGFPWPCRERLAGRVGRLRALGRRLLPLSLRWRERARKKCAADCYAVGVAAVGSGPIMATRLIERLKIRFCR